MSCRVGDLSLSISWFVCEFFSVGEFLSPSCYSVSCLSVSCHVTDFIFFIDCSYFLQIILLFFIFVFLYCDLISDFYRN